MTEHAFEQYLLILSFSLLGVLILQRLRMATIVAYMVVGVVIGPNALGFVADPEEYAFLAEFGVVFLLFALGLEFNLKKMLSMSHAVFGVGGFQVLICTGIFTTAVYLWGAELPASFVIAGALALSSTAIVTKELSNNHQLHNTHGQLSIGVLLFQDLAAIVFLVLVPVIGAGEGENMLGALGEAGIASAIVVVVLLAVGHWLLPLVFREVAKHRSDEIMLLTTLVVVLLAAWFTHALGLSMTLGAFIIGMMLGGGPARYQIESDIRPFRDILLGLFFVTIGMNLNLLLLGLFLPRILLFTAALIAIKLVAVALVVRLLGYGSRDATVVGLNLAQAGEFGLALMALALSSGAVPSDQASFVILIATFSMMASPFLIRYADPISRKLFSASDSARSTMSIDLDLSDHVIIGGYGRLGSLLVEFLETNEIPYVAIEADIEIVTESRKAGRNVVFGDSNSLEILHRCQIEEARLVVLTFRSLDEGKQAIAKIRNDNADIPILVRCQDHGHYEELISLGASHVIPEVLESSLLIGRQMLELLDMDEAEIETQVQRFLETKRLANGESA